jgi:rhamnosyltransferase
VITYYPSADLEQNLARLRPQVDKIIVVDNTEGSEALPLLTQLRERLGVDLFPNETNLGIAAALNIGIHQALSSGYEWIATFDQDSLVTEDYFRRMFFTYQSCTCREKVPLLAPLLCYSSEQSAEQRGGPSVPVYTFTRTAMSSGSLIRADIFAREGFYDESFFMDYVDYEFCLRLWKHGWKIIRANHAHLLHRLGLPQTHSLAGFKVTIKSHNAWRRYYIMRNRFVVFRRYALSSPAWCLYDFSWIFLELTKIILFEKDKLAQFRATCRGLWHGLSGNMQAKP